MGYVWGRRRQKGLLRPGKEKEDPTGSQVLLAEREGERSRSRWQRKGWGIRGVKEWTEVLGRREPWRDPCRAAR